MLDHQEGESQNKQSSNQGSVNNNYRKPHTSNNNLGTGKKTL